MRGPKAPKKPATQELVTLDGDDILSIRTAMDTLGYTLHQLSYPKCRATFLMSAHVSVAKLCAFEARYADPPALDCGYNPINTVRTVIRALAASPEEEAELVYDFIISGPDHRSQTEADRLWWQKLRCTPAQWKELSKEIGQHEYY